MSICLKLVSVMALISTLISCGGLQPTVGGVTTATQPQKVGEQPQKAAHRKLLYVSTAKGVSFYTYPQGNFLSSMTVSGFPTGICTDFAGNVFVPAAAESGTSTVYKYPHGDTSPSAQLADTGSAVGCSTDKISGSLAVVNQSDTDGPDVAIYSEETGSPVLYPSNGSHLTSCSYDDNGNLFIGAENGGYFSLLELPNGGSALTTISLNYEVGGWDNVGQNVQWDGQYVAVTSVHQNVSTKVYRFSVSGSEGTLEATTTLTSHGVDQRIKSPLSWIQKNTIIVPGDHGEMGFWPYPKGGNQKRHIFTNPIGIGPTVSVK